MPWSSFIQLETAAFSTLDRSHKTRVHELHRMLHELAFVNMFHHRNQKSALDADRGFESAVDRPGEFWIRTSAEIAFAVRTCS